MSNRFDQLARWHGIPPTYTDAHGRRRWVPAASRRAVLAALGVDADGAVPQAAPPDRRLRAGEARCFSPSSLAQAPAWGLFCQLYELRSRRNWGIGDYRDLADLATIAGQAGADFLGVNPLHALFLAAPERCSPFSPSNRAFFNPLYIAVDAVPGAGPPPDLGTVCAAERVDYRRVAALKLAALREIFARAPFRDAAARADHDRFIEDRGRALYNHALFEAISRDQVQAGQPAGWTGWAVELRDPNSRTVRAFAAQNEEAIAFYRWLQWIADRQLAAAQEAARAAGMRIGLYLDLAVGEAPDGSAGWGGQAMLRGLRIGAPPDLYQTNGQDWGLAALSPEALVAQEFAPFRAMIRAQLAHAGALRIDHAMALWQLFLIPDGMPARRGAYLRYPLRDMLRVLAEESRAARALIVGEDLGSVPRGFRRAMREANILSYRVLYFEQDARGFIPERRYPVSALACLSTHDLPTLADWWQGRDIEQRAQFGLVDAPTTVQHSAQRQAERENLLAALRASGSLSDAAVDRQTVSLELLCAAHHFIARTPAKLAAARLADLVGPQAATNVPGTSESTYPNWQLRSPTALEDLNDNPTFRRVAALLAQARPRPA